MELCGRWRKMENLDFDEDAWAKAHRGADLPEGPRAHADGRMDAGVAISIASTASRFTPLHEALAGRAADAARARMGST